MNKWAHDEVRLLELFEIIKTGLDTGGDLSING